MIRQLSSFAKAIPWILLVATYSHAQKQPVDPSPDVTKMSSAKLLNCFDFDSWKSCHVAESTASGWIISDELARRGEVHPLLIRYWKEHNWMIRDGIEHVAYHFDTPEVIAFMRQVVARRVFDGEDRYYPVNYLAEHCDTTALKLLSKVRYHVGCMQFENSLKLFGKCKYRPAIPYLVGTALYDICGNNIASAQDSLHALYPDSPADFGQLDTLQKYFCRRAKEDGFHVDCASK
jgi:hypothetical protein